MSRLYRALFVTGLVLAATSCALFTKQNARTVLDAAQVACSLENALLGDADIAKACGIADILIPDLRAILSAHRKQVAAARRDAGVGMALCVDGGAP